MSSGASLYSLSLAQFGLPFSRQCSGIALSCSGITLFSSMGAT